jgi:hypothetical protein
MGIGADNRYAQAQVARLGIKQQPCVLVRRLPPMRPSPGRHHRGRGPGADARGYAAASSPRPNSPAAARHAAAAPWAAMARA